MEKDERKLDCFVDFEVADAGRVDLGTDPAGVEGDDLQTG